MVGPIILLILVLSLILGFGTAMEVLPFVLLGILVLIIGSMIYAAVAHHLD